MKVYVCSLCLSHDPDYRVYKVYDSEEKAKRWKYRETYKYRKESRRYAPDDDLLRFDAMIEEFEVA